jgi:hypothetical protein
VFNGFDHGFRLIVSSSRVLPSGIGGRACAWVPSLRPTKLAGTPGPFHVSSDFRSLGGRQGLIGELLLHLATFQCPI